MAASFRGRGAVGWPLGAELRVGRGPGDEEEPDAGGRCPTPPRAKSLYEMVETPSAAAPTARVAADPVGGIVDPDAELVERWQEGDEVAFEMLVRRHERRVFGLALRMLGDREEAQTWPRRRS